METGLLRHMQSKSYHYCGNPGVTQSTQALSKQWKIGNHGNEMRLSHSPSRTTPTHQVMSSRRKAGDNKCFEEQAQRQACINDVLTLKDGTDRLSRNVDKELPPYAA